ncbi:MAG: 6-phosphogluconolactonase [Deltaproteobacteria bacterium]
MTHTEIIIKENAYLVAYEGARIFCRISNEAVSARGRCFVALSGNETSRSMHRLMATEPFRSLVPWDCTHIFWVDERFVPHRDPQSHYGKALLDFLSRVPIPTSNIHPMPVDSPPQEAAERYEREIMRTLLLTDNGIPSFDAVFLGIEPEGGMTVPFSVAEGERDSSCLVVSALGGESPAERLILGHFVLRHAKNLVFFAAGSGKALVIKDVLAKTDPAHHSSPNQPDQRTVLWILDQDAASLLRP